MRRIGLAAAAVLLTCLAAAPGPAQAAEGGEGAASWRLEQPSPPPPPPGQSEPPAPVPLGTVGDIEFWEPLGSAPQANRGLLITHGNGDAVPPGVWAYNGRDWHEIADVCGATDGRIAWAGPAEFWTVSDQRPGQAAVNGELPKLEDRSLCHFGSGAVLASYAHLAFQADSYQGISGAACLPPEPPAVSSADCWFGGEKLEPIGSFHLHWNGSTLAEQPYTKSGDPVTDMRALEHAIFESVAYSRQDPHEEEHGLSRPPVLHLAEAGAESFEPFSGELPLYDNPNEPPEALAPLRLGSTEGVLWAAAGKEIGVPGLSAEQEGQLTVIRRIDGVWTQVFGGGEEGGPSRPLPDLFESQQEEQELLGGPASEAKVTAVAPEPGTEDAWLALAPQNATPSEEVAVLVHISARGEVIGVQALPSRAERELPSNTVGAAKRLVCPGREDCWMANVNGWLYHLAPEGERQLPLSELPGFPEGRIVSERPPDEGIPQEVVDAPPPDTSGLPEEKFEYGESIAEQKEPKSDNLVTLPLLSHQVSRLRGTTLILSFHLSVKARVRLLAKRGRQVIAETPKRVMKAGNHQLELQLNPHRWPKKLELETHALAPLRVVSSLTGPGANVTTESTRQLGSPLAKLVGEAGLLP